jgi:hypothetical protein
VGSKHGSQQAGESIGEKDLARGEQLRRCLSRVLFLP